MVTLALIALAGCQDAGDSPLGPRVQFAQGDNGTWTVNSLADPGDGVCDDTECTLREAIAAAAPGDKIVFEAVLQGDIKLTAGALFLGKHLIIEGAGRIGLDAQGSSHVMTVVISNSGPARLAGLTFKNGHSSDVISGGGLIVTDGEVTFDGAIVSDNTSLESGGGISIGGVLTRAKVTLLNSTISNNSAHLEGGGIFVQGGSELTLINSTVDGNHADERGGGIFNEGTLTVTASTISNNDADGSDGGLSNRETASATIVRSTISGNRATAELGATGGILNVGTLELRSSTISRNTGQNRGGLRIVSGAATVQNSIIAGNTPVDCGSAQPTSLGHNLASSSCGFAATGDVQVAPSQVFTEVLDQNLSDNGGPTKTHALIARGRAVDAGYCPGETEDQRGFPRPVDDPVMPNALDGCDIGAFELQAPVTPPGPSADLMISQAVNKTSVKQGELLTYSIRVQNLGPETAPNVVVTDLLPSGVTFVEARKNRGTVTAPPKGETGTVTWFVGELVDQANEVAEIVVTVLVRGKTTITNTASVTGDVADPNQANNSAAITVSVAAGSSKPSPKK